MMHEVDPAAVRQLAEEIILGHAQDVDHLTIHERLDGYVDLSEEEEDSLADDVHEPIDKAVITVTFPGVESP